MPYKPAKLVKPPSKLTLTYRKCLGHVARQVIAIRLFVSSEPISSTAADGRQSIKVVCISDTHNTQPQLPDGDLLLHAGDLTNRGTFAELQAQLDWLNAQPHTHKVVIAGNHDLLLDPAVVSSLHHRIQEKPGEAAADLRFGDIHYLCNEQVTLTFHTGPNAKHARQLTIYGSPTTPQFGNWAFQVPPIRDVWNGRLSGMPPDPAPLSSPWTKPDILLTHGPPKGYLDEDGKGCEHLMREIARARPSLVVFGHIHPGYGQETVLFDKVHNLCTEIVEARAGLLALLVLAWLVLREKILALVSPRELGLVRAREKRTHLVNAAVVGGPGNIERREPIVVTI